MLAATHSSRDAHHVRAIRSPVVATIIIGHDCGFLKSLLTPLLDALGALPSVLDGNINRCLPAVA
jgi:hypothetical protein